MEQEVKIILDLSDEVQNLLEQQHTNLYEEIQRAVPDLQLQIGIDPDAPAGSRGDVTTIILAASTLISSLTPLIIHILNRITPPNRSTNWEVEETETRQPDGTVILQRKRIRSNNEARPWATLPSPNSLTSTSSGQALPTQHKTGNEP